VFAFATLDSRLNVARVYAILAGQLFLTVLSVVLFGVNPGLTAWMLRPGLGAVVPMLSLSLSTVAWIVMCVSTTARRASPVKWQLLALFTLGEAVCVGFISSLYHFRSVVSAILATALATTGVSLYTVFQTDGRYDLSQWGASLSSFGLIFVVYGFVHLLQMTGVLPSDFLPYNETVSYCRQATKPVFVCMSILTFGSRFVLRSVSGLWPLRLDIVLVLSCLPYEDNCGREAHQVPNE
jgi:Inhibitor of apoptosis-promoting Bax1